MSEVALEISEASRNELDRRAAALGQGRRIQAYLPVLKARSAELEAELAEVRELISDEQEALEDLAYEGKHPLSVVEARRRRKNGRATARAST